MKSPPFGGRCGGSEVVVLVRMEQIVGIVQEGAPVGLTGGGPVVGDGGGGGIVEDGGDLAGVAGGLRRGPGLHALAPGPVDQRRIAEGIGFAAEDGRDGIGAGRALRLPVVGGKQIVVGLVLRLGRGADAAGRVGHVEHQEQAHGADGDGIAVEQGELAGGRVGGIAESRAGVGADAEAVVGELEQRMAAADGGVADAHVGAPGGTDHSLADDGVAHAAAYALVGVEGDEFAADAGHGGEPAESGCAAAVHECAAGGAEDDEEHQLHYLEDTIDYLTLTAQDNHVQRLREKKCHTSSGVIYTKALQDLERVGDHSYNIAWAARIDKNLIRQI